MWSGTQLQQLVGGSTERPSAAQVACARDFSCLRLAASDRVASSLDEMSKWAAAAFKGVHELRFHLCSESAASQALRCVPSNARITIATTSPR